MEIKSLNPDNVVVHIGLAKAGSTFLQCEVFPKLENVNFYGKQIFMNRIEKDKINLFSSEALSGILVTPYPPYKGDGFCNRFELQHRIKKLYPSARIIFVVRNKDELLHSHYREYVRQGSPLSFDEFYEIVKGELEVRFDFDFYVSFLDSLFDDVFVCSFELLKKDKKQFVKDICDFIGVEPPIFNNNHRNRGYNDVELRFALLVNRFVKSKLNPDGWFPKTRFFYCHKLLRFGRV